MAMTQHYEAPGCGIPFVPCALISSRA